MIRESLRTQAIELAIQTANAYHTENPLAASHSGGIRWDGEGEYYRQPMTDMWIKKGASNAPHDAETRFVKSPYGKDGFNRVYRPAIIVLKPDGVIRGLQVQSVTIDEWTPEDILNIIGGF